MAYRPPSAGTAQTMILIGLIFQIIFALLFFFVLGILALLAASAAALGAAFLIFPIIFTVLFGIIPLILLYVAYEFSYNRTRRGEYEAARGPTLVLAIIELIFGGVLPGIFYLIGYVKLGDAVNESRQPPGYAPGYVPGAPPMMMGQPPAAAPMAPAPAVAPPAPAAPLCPRCQRPGTWVAQYGRYYCYNDAQYI